MIIKFKNILKYKTNFLMLKLKFLKIQSKKTFQIFGHLLLFFAIIFFEKPILIKFLKLNESSDLKKK